MLLSLHDLLCFCLLHHFHLRKALIRRNSKRFLCRHVRSMCCGIRGVMAFPPHMQDFATSKLFRWRIECKLQIVSCCKALFCSHEEQACAQPVAALVPRFPGLLIEAANAAADFLQ
ncbi:hypothetical protein LN96_05240 [Xanthomonas citri pv. citri]|nr:hypothetical protein LN96_05240 [Xanthomonas citri pv. citri]